MIDQRRTGIDSAVKGVPAGQLRSLPKFSNSADVPRRYSRSRGEERRIPREYLKDLGPTG